MAKMAPSYEMPLDTPREVPQRETDAPGNAKFGFTLTSGSTIEGRLKGNIGWEDLPASKALTGPGPFAYLKNGR